MCALVTGVQPCALPILPPVDPAAPEARPLYAQVRTLLLQRLIEGIWKPGTALPSEMQLAQELGVSQGTVRKALDDLAAENLVVRRQGRGTFVAEHDTDRALFHFFHLVGEERSEEHTSELQSLMRISYAVFCLKKKN